MSRKQKIYSEKVVVKNKSFEGIAIPYQVLDEEQQIQAAIADNDVSEKEKKLLAVELEKPFGKRSKALVNKYRGRTNETLNGYPDSVSSGGYTITATAVDDADIPLESRPEPYYSQIIIKDRTNSWTFRFPIKRETSSDGAEIYRLDGYNTFIYKSGVMIDSLSDEGTPYDILSDFFGGDKDSAEKFLTDGGFYNFKFPDFYVKYTRDPAVKGDDSADITTDNTQKVTSGFDSETYAALSPLQKKVLVEAMKNGINIAPVKQFEKNKCIVEKVLVGTRVGKYRWLAFDDIMDGTIFATILDGAAAASAHLGRDTLTAVQITNIIDAKNKKLRDEVTDIVEKKKKKKKK